MGRWGDWLSENPNGNPYLSPVGVVVRSVPSLYERPLIQGLRMKTSDNFGTEVRIEQSALSFVGQRAGDGMLSQPVHCHVPQAGQVARGTAIAHGAGVVAEHHVERPVAAVFNAGAP